MVRRSVWLAAATLAALALTTMLAPALGATGNPAGPLGPHRDYIVGNDAETTGLSCSTPEDCTLRSALQLASANGGDADITFTEGTHAITLTGALTIDQPGVHVHGAYGQVKVNANGVAQAFVVWGSDAILENLVIYGAGAGSANVWITGAAVRVRVARSVIGPPSIPDETCAGSPIAHSGIFIDSTGDALDQTIPPAYLYSLLIASIGFDCPGGSNPGNGIHLYNTHNVVIGADESGNATPLELVRLYRNGGSGIYIDGGSSNAIRNTTLQFNKSSGLVINGSHGNTVRGIDTWRNNNSGVELRNASYGNEIGCTVGGGDASTSNRLVGNLREGVYIAGADTRQNYVFCNEITGNGINGVVVTNGAYQNHIGSGVPERNVISGNGNDGVQILDGAYGNEVLGNFIGTNISGTNAYANVASGIAIYAGAHDNLVGGATINNANTIGGNGVYGIYIADANTYSNTVRVNRVGAAMIGYGLIVVPNGSDGITIQGGAHDNLIAGSGGLRLSAEFNTGSGIYIVDSPRNRIENASFSYNGLYGVILSGSQTSQTVLYDVIAQTNELDGVGERGGAANNTWSWLHTRWNRGMGVDRDASSDSTNTPTPPFPTVGWVDKATGAVHGTAGPTVFPLYGSTVEVYWAIVGRGGFPQSNYYVGSAATDASGAWVVTDTEVATGGGCYVAFETLTGSNLAGAYNFSTELSATNCRAFVPLVLRNN